MRGVWSTALLLASASLAFAPPAFRWTAALAEDSPGQAAGDAGAGDSGDPASGGEAGGGPGEGDGGGPASGGEAGGGPSAGDSGGPASGGEAGGGPGEGDSGGPASGGEAGGGPGEGDGDDPASDGEGGGGPSAGDGGGPASDGDPGGDPGADGKGDSAPDGDAASDDGAATRDPDPDDNGPAAVDGEDAGGDDVGADGDAATEGEAEDASEEGKGKDADAGLADAPSQDGLELDAGPGFSSDPGPAAGFGQGPAIDAGLGFGLDLGRSLDAVTFGDLSIDGASSLGAVSVPSLGLAETFDIGLNVSPAPAPVPAPTSAPSTPAPSVVAAAPAPAAFTTAAVAAAPAPAATPVPAPAVPPAVTAVPPQAVPPLVAPVPAPAVVAPAPAPPAPPARTALGRLMDAILGGSPSGSDGDPLEHVAQEIIAVDLTPVDRLTLALEGFPVISTTALGGIGLTLDRLRAPVGLTLDEALTAARAAAPGAVLDVNHLYRNSGVPCEGAACWGASLVRVATAPGDSCARGAPIAIIDTAIDRGHPTLRSASITARSFLPEGVDNGPADHGTAVAALLVGRVAPGVEPLASGARLLAAEAFALRDGKLRADAAAVVAALDWAIGSRARVVGLSLTGPGNAVLERAVAAAAGSAILVAAGGNDGPTAGPAYPAAYPGVIAVAALDSRKRVWRGGNRGAYIDIAAPGVDVVSAAPGGGTAAWTGTSFAVPFAVAAAMRARAEAGADPEAARALLARSAEDIGAPGRDDASGHGLARAPGLRCF